MYVCMYVCMYVYVGSSDPYVQVTLLPQWKYVESNKKVYKTQVMKGTLDPYFNKQFLMYADTYVAIMPGKSPNSVLQT